MSARPACAVELCASLSTARRVVCCIHAGAAAFAAAERAWAPSLADASRSAWPDVAESWLCPRCATARIRDGRAGTLRVVDDERIDERNRVARTAAERSACADCGRHLAAAGPPRRRRRHAPTQAALRLTPPPFGGEPVMHAASLDSPRLQRALDRLADGRWHSTRDLVVHAHICAVNSVVAELRTHGYGIVCRQDVDPDGGGRVWLYRLASSPEPSPGGFRGGEPAAGSAGDPPAREAGVAARVDLVTAGGSKEAAS